MSGRGAGQPGALGRKIVLGGQMAGGEEFLKRAMRECELPLATLLALADQQTGALLDVVDHHVGLVLAVQ